MAQIQPTHENAYRNELSDAEHDLELAQGRVNHAKASLAEKTGKPVKASTPVKVSKPVKALPPVKKGGK